MNIKKNEIKRISEDAVNLIANYNNNDPNMAAGVGKIANALLKLSADKKEIKDIIKSRRIELDLSMDYVADRVGVSKATISRWESGFIESMRAHNIAKLAQALRLTPAELMGWSVPKSTPIRKLPVYGIIKAGIPIATNEDIVAEEQFSTNEQIDKNYAALRIADDSMSPFIMKNDTVIMRLQSKAESGDIVVVTIGTADAVVKRIRYERNFLWLLSDNPSYAPAFYTKKDCADLQVKIIGKVEEVRRKL